MILLLNTSTPVCTLSFVDGNDRHDFEWQAGRDLARGLLKYIDMKLHEVNKSWADITGLGVFEGPGSFTGIRIGLTVMNTVSDAQNIPIVGARGADWVAIVLERLTTGENGKIVLPYYGGEANITKPSK